ncbi:ArsR/SmtB family transcription factor [Kribbella deserti]|uniref:ArsR/SmtB family transcription factor n=1 Tax=Kribbella deserti TaxID=1926257 RepID=A0ABV6QN45_9ACTN
MPLPVASLDSATAAEGAILFRALADPIRLRLLSIIASATTELCVCDLSGDFEVSAPTISHHLKVLREAGLVEFNRRSTWVYYRTVPERLQRISALLPAPSPAAAAIR